MHKQPNNAEEFERADLDPEANSMKLSRIKCRPIRGAVRAWPTTRPSQSTERRRTEITTPTTRQQTKGPVPKRANSPANKLNAQNEDIEE